MVPSPLLPLCNASEYRPELVVGAQPLEAELSGFGFEYVSPLSELLNVGSVEKQAHFRLPPPTASPGVSERRARSLPPPREYIGVTTYTTAKQVPKRAPRM